MAENKKGVLVYADWGSTFDNLTDEEAGRLIKHFFDYVRDMDPEPKDRITALLFEPIKQTLKRDLKKWTAESEKGKLGNLKRWQPDLYDAVIKGAMTLDVAESIAKDRPRHTPTRGDSGGVAKIAVSDSVNVSDSVKVKKTKGGEIATEFNFDFVDDRFQVPFFDWIKFRREIDEPILHQVVLEKTYFELVSLSKNNSETAEQIVKQSMDKGWKHLYVLKEEKEKSSAKKENYGKSTGDTRYDALANFVNR